MLEFLKNKKIMIVVAHPDDELLGLGGTMNKLIKEYNVKTHLVILGEGLTSRSNVRDVSKWKEKLEIHKENIIGASKAIGYHSIETYNFPDNRFDEVALLDIIKVIEIEKKNFQPSIIFTHHGGDLNIDHQKTFEATLTSSRPVENESVKTIITFETPSGTEWRASSDPKHFVPNFFVEINKENLNSKILGMEHYEFEKRKYPHPRSPKSLKIQAQRWGVSIGCDFAEAFTIIRTIS